MARECGDCRMCCTSAEVVELDKPSGVQCKHECKGGCAIYDRRPSACAAFQCSWLAGDLPEDLRFRPDSLGFMLETMYLTRPDGSRVTILIGLAQTAEGLQERLSGLDLDEATVLAVTLIDSPGEMIVAGSDDAVAYYQAWLSFCMERGYVEAEYANGSRTIPIGG